MTIHYRGFRGKTIAGACHVFRIDEAAAVKELDPKPSLKVWNHSPDGFQWGYSGSGPAQLALALLLDVTGDSDLASSKHQTFKRDFVAGWGNEWQISADEIRDWLK